jgi:hypothetical protein
MHCNETVAFPANSSSLSLYVSTPPLTSGVDTADDRPPPTVPFSVSCPIYVRALPGQRLSVSLFMLSSGHHAHQGHPNSVVIDDDNDDDDNSAGFRRPGNPLQAPSARVSGFEGNVAHAQSVDAWHMQQRRQNPCGPDGVGSFGSSDRVTGTVFVVDYGRRHAVGELCSMPRYTLTGRLNGNGRSSPADVERSASAHFGQGYYISVDSAVGIFVDLGGPVAPEAASDADFDRLWSSTGLVAPTGDSRATAAFIVRVEGILCIIWSGQMTNCLSS